METPAGLFFDDIDEDDHKDFHDDNGDHHIDYHDDIGMSSETKNGIMWE